MSSSVSHHLPMAAVVASSSPARNSSRQWSRNTRATVTSVFTSASLKRVFWNSAIGLAERLALARVVDGPSQRRLHDGDRADGDQQALARQLVHQAGEAAALLAQDIGGRHAHVLEEQLGGVLRVLADLLEVAPALEAGTVGLDQHQRHALGAGATYRSWRRR